MRRRFNGQDANIRSLERAGADDPEALVRAALARDRAEGNPALTFDAWVRERLAYVNSWAGISVPLELGQVLVVARKALDDWDLGDAAKPFGLSGSGHPNRPGVRAQSRPVYGWVAVWIGILSPAGGEAWANGELHLATPSSVLTTLRAVSPEILERWILLASARRHESGELRFNAGYSVAYKRRPGPGRLHWVDVRDAKDPMEASRVARQRMQGLKGWREYGVSRVPNPHCEAPAPARCGWCRRLILPGMRAWLSDHFGGWFCSKACERARMFGPESASAASNPVQELEIFELDEDLEENPAFVPSVAWTRRRVTSCPSCGAGVKEGRVQCWKCGSVVAWNGRTWR